MMRRKRLILHGLNRDKLSGAEDSAVVAWRCDFWMLPSWEVDDETKPLTCETLLQAAAKSRANIFVEIIVAYTPFAFVPSDSISESHHTRQEFIHCCHDV